MSGTRLPTVNRIGTIPAFVELTVGKADSKQNDTNI